jgi:signal transduction histidine kinase/ActR/RegA family two-component response regulator
MEVQVTVLRAQRSGDTLRPVLELGRVLLLALVATSAYLGWRTVRSGTGAVTHWVVGWAAAGFAGAIVLSEDELPFLAPFSHTLGSLFATLLLSGALAYAGRRIPGWLLPAALTFGFLRAAVAATGRESLAFGLGLACEPVAVLAAAFVVWRSRGPGPSASERLLGPAMAVLALVGAGHLVFLTRSGAPHQLVSLWIVVAPPILGLQIQAAADRLRRRVREDLEARVAERTSELAASEAHLQQVQRLESLGVLAGGIAHDFNNLLTVIRGHARLALGELPALSPLRPRLERIQEAAQHAGALTEQMLAYAGKSAPALLPLDVASVVGSLAELLRASISERSTLRVDCAPGLPAVEGDPGQLRQVLMNLVLNASDACAEAGGSIDVRLFGAVFTWDDLAEAFGNAQARPGRFVVLEVADDGYGMDPATLARVFEPFFTTKFTGRGLGMAAVLGIVRAHEGAIRIDSAPAQGTRVQVLLPASLRPAQVEAGGARPAAPLVRRERRGRVLVVDDDAALRELVSEILARAGFEVISADGGQAAIDAVRAAPGAVGVVLLDLAMPGLGGEETFLRLRELAPALPVILVSGYDAARASLRFAAQGLDEFLHKPFEPEQLVMAVEAALSRRRRATLG